MKSIHKKDSRTDKENYRPVSKLPSISKIYETCLFSQLNNYFDTIFSKLPRGFRKGFSFSPMIGKWRESTDQGESFGALFN